MAQLMAILNLTPDSFWAPSRYCMGVFARKDVDIVDIGAVSTRPGAPDVSEEEEWRRLAPVMSLLREKDSFGKRISVDTFRAGIVRRVFDEIGPFMVNDISAGEDDPAMLPLVGELGLRYIAMHKRGNPRTMDALCDYSGFAAPGDPTGVVGAVKAYFEEFAKKAEAFGIEDWVLDPGFGFAKSEEQNLALLEAIPALKTLGRPVLVGIADKRFTHGHSREMEKRAVELGADIIRTHIDLAD